MARSRLALGISLLSLVCSGVTLVIVLQQSQLAMTGQDPDRHSSSDDSSVSLRQSGSAPPSLEIQPSAITPTDPVEAFQAQLIRNEELLRQLREGELTRSQDQ